MSYRRAICTTSNEHWGLTCDVLKIPLATMFWSYRWPSREKVIFFFFARPRIWIRRRFAMETVKTVLHVAVWTLLLMFEQMWDRLNWIVRAWMVTRDCSLQIILQKIDCQDERRPHGVLTQDNMIEFVRMEPLQGSWWIAFAFVCNHRLCLFVLHRHKIPKRKPVRIKNTNQY